MGGGEGEISVLTEVADGGADLNKSSPEASWLSELCTRRVMKKIWKKYRSPGELARRKKRKMDYLSRQQATPSTPQQEPETLESGVWNRQCKLIYVTLESGVWNRQCKLIYVKLK